MKRAKQLRSLVLSGLLLPAPNACQAADAPNLDLARQLNQTFVSVADKVSPSVVVITVLQKADAAAMDDEEDMPYDQLPREFRRYYHRQQQDEGPPEKSQGQGSGVILREDGYILTNGHVVEDAESIEVRLRDGRVFKAKVRGIDSQSDVAVIKIDARDLPAAKFGDSNRTRVGEFAIAIGAPFNLDYSVTFGHVSAKGRSNIILGTAGSIMDQDFIQTDANINPGNSGGPLVNIEGEVIGINTLIRGLHTGIGFAIPSALALEISDKLITDGKFTRAWLGVGIRAVRDMPEFRSVVKGIDDGVIIETIQPNGPAAKSDLRPSDVITTVDGKRVSTAQELRAEVRNKKIGQGIALEVFRAGKTFQVKLNAGEWADPATLAAAKTGLHSEADPAGLGITVHPMNRELANQFGIETGPGLIIVGIEKGSIAAEHGIKPGDVVTAVNQQPVSNVKQFHEALKKADVKKGVILNLLSGDVARFEILRLGSD